MMNKGLAAILMIFSFGLSLNLLGQSEITIDGDFLDWEAFPKSIDAEGDGEDQDLLNYAVTNDDEHIYIYLEALREFDLFDGNFLTLYADLDGNQLTGNTINQIGAEIKIDFAKKQITYFYPGDVKTEKLSKLPFLALPTFTSEKFEMAIPLLRDEYIGSLVKSNTIYLQWIWENAIAEWMPNDGEKMESEIYKKEPFTTLDTITHKLDNGFRLLHYNTLHDGLTKNERKENFETLLKGLSPDIIGFNELWETTETQTKTILEKTFPGTQWNVSKLLGNITATKFPVLQWNTINPKFRLLGALIKVPTINNDSILVYHINGHLSCCAKDEKRMEQATSLHQHLDSLINSGWITEETPIIFSGDMNLVGFRNQYHKIVFGDANVDVNTEPSPVLLDINPKQINNNTHITWRDSESSYPPGRLDYVFFNQKGFSVSQSLVLETKNLTSKDLKKYDLTTKLTQKASDHLPIIVDFLLKN